MSPRRFWLRGGAIPILCLSAIAGCAQREIYPVQGNVVFSDGKPAAELVGGFVIFDAQERKASARGIIKQDGSFQMTTLVENDGAYLGKHRVQINPPHSLPEDLANHPQATNTMHPRFARFETSGLEVTVEATDNKVEFKIDRIHH